MQREEAELHPSRAHCVLLAALEAQHQVSISSDRASRFIGANESFIITYGFIYLHVSMCCLQQAYRLATGINVTPLLGSYQSITS